MRMRQGLDFGAGACNQPPMLYWIGAAPGMP